MNEARYVPCAETAREIRSAPKSAFPGVKFSVVSKTFAGGASIRVGYSDGPTTAAVEAIADRFSSASFDGMTDSTTYHVDEFNGERVRWGAHYVFVTRDLSAVAEAAAVKIAAEKFGVALTPEFVGDFPGFRFPSAHFAEIVRFLTVGLDLRAEIGGAA